MMSKAKQSSQAGAVSILALLGIIAVMAMIPVTTKLVSQNQESRTQALEPGCADRCHWQGGGENWDCGGDWNACCCKLASNKSICGGCGRDEPPVDGDGDDCERDKTGACNPACCAYGTTSGNKICDVPNGYCQSGYSSRGSNSRKVKQCVDTSTGAKCYWQTCSKNDPGCVEECSTHSDCRGGDDGGDDDKDEPRSKPTPTPVLRGKILTPTPTLKPTPTPKPWFKPEPTPTPPKPGAKSTPTPTPKPWFKPEPTATPTPKPWFKPEPTATPTPVPASEAAPCANEGNGSHVLFNGKCYRCWWGNLQKQVDYDYCVPPYPPKETPTPKESEDLHFVDWNPSEQESWISGNMSGSKISEGTITLVDASGETYFSETDQDGNFSLGVPTNQDYTVRVSAPGYKLLTFNWNPVDGLDYFTKIKLEKTGTEKEGNFEIKEDTREILLIGWNLISLSRKLGGPLLASELLEEINRQGGLAIAISRWQDSRWETFLSGVEKNNFPIELGQAYFVENLQEARFELGGEEITQPLALELKPGWNAVGLPKMVNCPEETCSARSLLNLIDEAKANSAKACSYFESGLWVTAAKEEEDFFGYNFSFKSGKGYLLKASQSLRFSP